MINLIFLPIRILFSLIFLPIKFTFKILGIR